MITMRLMRPEKKFTLDAAGVDAVSAEVQAWLHKVGVKHNNIVRLRLTMETVLLSISEHYGGSIEGYLAEGRRFGTPYLRFRYEGESFDPLSDEVVSADDWTRSLLANIGLTPLWTYKHGVNYLTLRAPRETLRSETVLVIAAVLAVLIGLLRGYLPEDAARRLTNYVLSPLSDAFMNVLGTFVGLMVFFSVVAGICSIGSISDFSKMGRYVLLRLTGMTTLGTGVSILLALPFFRFGEGTPEGGRSQLGALVDLLFDAFPTDPVSPFIQGNMLQIIFISVMVGCALLVLESQVEGVKTLVQQFNMLLLQIVQGICRLLPVYIFVSLVVMIWQNGAGVFFSLYKPILIHTVIILLFLAAKLFIVCGRLRISPRVMLSTMKVPMVIGFTTASSSAAFGNMVDINEHKLGIAPELDGFGLPFANLLVGSTHGSMMVVILFYLSEYYSIPASPVWLLTAWIMSSILCMTIPPVSGGMLVVLGILLSQLGVPTEGLAAAGLIGIVADFAATAVKIAITHLELLRQAEHLDMLDRKLLAKKMS